MIGETIGNFKIVSRLGRGGMGEVWLAEQQSIGTKVAIKLLNAAISEDTEHVQRFFNEARAVSRIQHSGIVKIFDVGHHGGHAYLIMEYLEGETLAQRIAHAKRLPLGDLCEIGRQAASVLDATHSAGITHRDLKPDNIFIVPDRELSCGYRVKILDFGIAKLTGTLANVSPRTTGAMGTPAYMAPEQWGDASKVDWRADLYSLGCVTFEMACGRPPFVVSNIAEACAKHLHDPAPHIRELTPDAPQPLDALVDRLLAKSPPARADSMREVERAFGSVATGQPLGLAATIASTTSSGSSLSAGSAPIPRVTPTSHNGPATHQGRVSASVMQTAPGARPRSSSKSLLILGALVIAGVTVLGALKIMKRPRMPTIVAREEHHAPDDAAPPLATPPITTDAAPAPTPPVDAAVQPAANPPGPQPVRPKVGDGKGSNGKPVKEGTIDADGVFQATLADKGIQNCYLTEVKKDPTIGGKLTASVWIDESGRATSVTATGVSTAVERCVERRLKAVQYPKAVGGPVLAYIPFSFEPPAPEDVAKGGTFTAHASGGDEPLRVSPTQAEILAEMKRLKSFLDDCGHGEHARVQLEIAPDGSVTSAHVLGAVAQLTIAPCVEKTIKTRASFPKSKSGVKVTMPFRLAK